MLAFVFRIMAIIGLPSWILPLIIAGFAAASIGGAYIKGRIDASANCREASLKAQIAILELDLAVQKSADAVEAQALVEAEALSASQEMEITRYAEILKARPDRCPLSPADVDSLRKFGR